MKHILIAGVFAVCALGISIPSDAHAADAAQSARANSSIESINARLESLTKMIDDLKKRLEDIKKGTGTTTTPEIRKPRPTACEQGSGWFGNRSREVMRKRCQDEMASSTTLRIAPESGKVPHKVEITAAPREVLKKMNECVYSVGRMGTSGNGLTVDWGDGTVSPTANASSSGQSCKNEVKKHTYTKPGTFTVTVRSWAPGANDAPVTSWQGTAQVTVKATSSYERPTTTKPISKFIRAAQKARAALADKLDVRTRSVQVVKVESKEWSDGCLGLGGAAESCAAALTPGYRVTMKHATTTYYARTDKMGKAIRIEP